MLKLLGKEFHQSWLVVVFAVGIVAGTVLALVFRVYYFASVGWIVFASVLLVISYLRPKYVFIVIAVLAGMIFAFCRASSELVGEDYIRQFYGQEVVMSGVVDGDPESDEGTTKLKLAKLAFGEDGEHRTKGSMLVTINYDSEIRRGDTIKLRGKLLAGFGTYAGYMYKPKVVDIKRPEPGDLVLKVRNWFADRIKMVIPEQEANLGLSYLLGMRAGLTDEFSEKLRAVGLVHIVVASGAHLSILVEIARRAFGKLSRFVGVLFSVLFVVVFMAMVGWTPSIMRAGIMAILTLVMWYVGRKMAPWRIILIVASITLMINPMFVINLGWLLSFASFAGIMMLGPRLTKFFYGQKKPGFVAGVVITTISATIMTLPVMLYFFGQVSLISVVANLLILPTLPVAMGLTFVAGVVSGVPLIGAAVGWCATKILDFHIMVVEFFGEQKPFLVEIPTYQPWVFVIYGLIVLGMLCGLARRKMVKYREVRINNNAGE